MSLMGVFEKGFTFNFFLFFGFGMAFSRWTRPEKKAHGWSLTEWSWSDLDHSGAAMTLFVITLGFALGAIFQAWKRHKRTRPRDPLP